MEPYYFRLLGFRLAWVFRTFVDLSSNSPYVSPSKVSNSYHKTFLKDSFYKTFKLFIRPANLSLSCFESAFRRI